MFTVCTAMEIQKNSTSSHPRKLPRVVKSIRNQERKANWVRARAAIPATGKKVRMRNKGAFTFGNHSFILNGWKTFRNTTPKTPQKITNCQRDLCESSNRKG